MVKNILGWDIGGAHLKVSALNASGQITDALILSCPLWKGMDQLTKSLALVDDHFSIKDTLHAITMTGELVDLFQSRRHGVEAIIEVMQKQFGRSNLRIFAGNKGFLKLPELDVNSIDDIASANWFASAYLVANKINNGLLIDIGSTTSDLITIKNAEVQTQGFTDFERLVSDELVYTGIIRTPVMAVAQSVEFNGEKVGLMAEHFATMADIFRLTGEINESHDLSDTADGAAKTPKASARRLARMMGSDVESENLLPWEQLAAQLRSKQVSRLLKACEKQLARSNLCSDDCFVGAGIGRFLAKELANQLGHPYIDFNQLLNYPLNQTTVSVADVAPAASVAYLLGTAINP